ncbi:MAG TPA: BON domain-containing protein [Chloroflexota bacterium]
MVVYAPLTPDRMHPPVSLDVGLTTVQSTTSKALSGEAPTLSIYSSFVVSPKHAEAWIRTWGQLASLAQSDSDCCRFQLLRDCNDELYFASESQWSSIRSYVAFELQPQVRALEEELLSMSFLQEGRCFEVEPITPVATEQSAPPVSRSLPVEFGRPEAPMTAVMSEEVLSTDTQLSTIVNERIGRFFRDEAVDRSRTTPPGRVIARASHGCVTLSGAVNWGFERTAVEEIVRDVPGVDRLKDLVVVAPETARTSQIRNVAGRYGRRSSYRRIPGRRSSLISHASRGSRLPE